MHDRLEEKALIRRYLDAYNRFDVDAMIALDHPEVAFADIADGEVTAEAVGVDQLRSQANQSKSLFSFRHQEPTRTDFSGNKAAVENSYEEVPAVDLPNGMQAGQRLKLNGQTQLDFKDGRIYKITDVVS